MAGPIPLNALNAFVIAARHGSFSKAADELHVTPAAVSQQIRALEDQLGIQLFHRLNRGIALTDAGQAGIERLQEGFDAITAAVQEMQTADQKSELNIWTSPSFATKWLMPRMQSFIEANPNIDLRISGSADLIDSDSTAPSLSAQILKAHNIDVAIRFGSGNYPGCDVKRVMEVDAITLCNPSLLADDAPLPLKTREDLLQHTLLHDESPYEGRPDWATWLKAANLEGKQAKHNLYFNSVTLALSAAVEGQGVVLTLDKLAQYDVDKGLLVKLFKLPMDIEHGYHLVTLQGTEQNSRVKIFREWLLKEIASDEGV